MKTWRQHVTEAQIRVRGNENVQVHVVMVTASDHPYPQWKIALYGRGEHVSLIGEKIK